MLPHLKRPQSATPLFLFTCENLALIFFRSLSKRRKIKNGPKSFRGFRETSPRTGMYPEKHPSVHSQPISNKAA